MREGQGRFLSKREQAVSFANGDMLIEGVAVISCDEGRFQPRGIDDLRKILCWPASDLLLEQRLNKIALLLNTGRAFEAIFIANLGAWNRYRITNKANFNPNQPRDNRARWTKDGSQPSGGAHIEDVQYRGFFP